MQEQQVKVGDVVAWDSVPNNAAVLGPRRVEFVRRGEYVGYWAQNVGWCWWHIHKACPVAEVVTIIALDVPADATADDLRTLAERFEVRESIMNMPACVHVMASTIEHEGAEWAWQWAAIRLHQAGWRPGMTAVDAARLLAAVVEKAIKADLESAMSNTDVVPWEPARGG